ncbi:MAG TPA: DNRLRE domain-containing protein [Tepidisphaeraceae bacterium]|nr:DNRLRE domain-containing protein [Tepidisphaeraceae bacterium]
MRIYLFAIISVFGIFVGAASADTVTSSADSWITEYSGLGGPDSNHGASTSLWSEGFGTYLTNPLVKFDVSAYTGRTVTGTSTVRLYLNDAGNDKDAITQVIDMRESLSAWQENTVTWNNYGGSGPALDTQSVNWGLEKYSYVSWVIPNTVVQSWIDNSANNKGLAFVGTVDHGSTDLLFSSREGNNAPELVFDTAPIGAPLPSSGAGALFLLGGLVLSTIARKRFSEPA